MQRPRGGKGHRLPQEVMRETRVAGPPEPRDKSHEIGENRQGDKGHIMLSLENYNLLRIES